MFLTLEKGVTEMNCSDAIGVMHEYLDGDTDAESASDFKSHLVTCSSCQLFFRQLETTEALLHVPQKMDAPAGLKASIMSSIPEVRKRHRWIPKLHPFAAAACAIVFIMLTAFTSRYYSDKDMVVEGALDQLYINGDTLVVPEGVTVNGNLKVKRGKVQIDGNVEGDVTVIEGSYNMASTAYISGRVTTVDAALDWIWYRIKSVFKRSQPRKEVSRGSSFRGGSLFVPPGPYHCCCIC
jgi:anti-sigma factor RsiW